MPKTFALVVLLAGCTRAASSASALPPDTDRDFQCVLRQLASEKDFDATERACMPGEKKRLVSILALLEDSHDLMALKAYVSVQSSIVLHQAERRGYRPVAAPGEK